MDWMGSKSAYKGPTLTERKQLRKASVRSFYIRTSISTSKMDLRTVFEAAGCVVTDVRVVFDGTQSTGVAYCDVADDESIEKGLTLDATELNEAPLRVRRNLNKDSLRNLVKERDSAFQKKLLTAASFSSPAASTGSAAAEAASLRDGTGCVIALAF